MANPAERRLRFQLPAAGLSWLAAALALAPFLDRTTAAWTALGFVLARLVAYELFRADRLATDPPGFQDAFTLAAASLSGSLIAVTAAVTLRTAPPWPALLLEATLHLTLLSGWLAWRRLGAASPPRQSARRALFLVNPDARAMVSALQADPGRTLEPVGWLDDRRDRLGASVDGVPVLGAVAELPYLVDWHQVRTVVALLPPHQRERADRLREQAEIAAVELVLLPSFQAALQSAGAPSGVQPVSSAA